jgi:CYTH domain-containing protein
MSLPPDLFARAAGEAIRRVARLALDQAVEAARRPGAHPELERALRRFDAQVSTLGARFGLEPAPDAETAEALLERVAAAGPEAALEEAVLTWSRRARSPLEVISMRLDDGAPRAGAPPEEASYGAVLAGHLRVAIAGLIATLEARAPEEARPRAARALDLLFPLEITGAAGAGADLASRLRAIADGAAAEPLELRAARERTARRARAPRPVRGAPEREALRLSVERVARALEAFTEREVEYKFLLRAFPPRAASGRRKALAQGYVPGERLHERLRRVEAAGEVRYVRTVKLGSGLARVEIEEETTARIFETMWPLTEGSRIHKERYAVEDGALTWTIDRFVDRDLVLAEVEVPSADVAPSPPPWLAEYIVRDVTDDPRYVNLNLAR